MSTKLNLAKQKKKNLNELTKKELIKIIREKENEISKLKEKIENLKREVNIDFLTSLSNRKRFIRALEDSIKGIKTHNYPFSLIILDIDNFKNINDYYGHIVGDYALKTVASLLKQNLRVNSVIGRLGGEEFGIILPGTNIENALKIAERLRKCIETNPIPILEQHKEVYISASFGVTEAKTDDTITSILNRADLAMYQAKRNGKNQIFHL